ncbi:MAG: DUF3301 domain-containing protein [Kangiellaceae bacterium]|nr:DUF3301 domain-containing protein [Kangiellaceae bacterium]
MTNLLIILFIALGIGFWLYNGRIRESAYRAAIKACEESYVQNLDGYVALKKVYFEKNTDGKIRFLRRYQFEFATDGANRYLGHVIMQGRWPVIVEMESVS